jgi:ferredoxin
MRARIRVNPAACDGFGFCAEILPEVIAIDEWGFPIVSGGQIPEGLEAEADRAVRCCPRRALAFEESGETRCEQGQA